MVSARRATVEDAPEIGRIHCAAWEVAYRGVVPDEWLERHTAERATEMWHRLLRDAGEGAVYVATDADAPRGTALGFASLALPARDEDVGPGAAELTTMYVDPPTWRRGAGRALMEAVLGFLSAGEWGELTLWVLEANDRARGFYVQAGFEADGHERSSGPGGPPEIRMRRALTSRR